MRKEVVKALIKAVPFNSFRFITKKGSILTVVKVITYSETDFKFMDIKRNVVVQEYEGIERISIGEV